jgi:hypothetical protein
MPIFITRKIFTFPNMDEEQETIGEKDTAKAKVSMMRSSKW